MAAPCAAWREDGWPAVSKGIFEYAKHGSIGISWVLTSVVYFYLGYKGGSYLDSRLGSSPAFLLVGLVGAMALSLRSMVSLVLAITSGQGGQDEGASRVEDRENRNKSTQETDDPERMGRP